MKIKRFINRRDAYDLVKQSADFKVRKHSAYFIIFGYVVVLLIIAGLLHIETVLYKTSEFQDPIPTAEVMVGIVFSIMMVMLIVGYMFTIIYRLKRIINLLEFQNLTYASAARAHSVFCFIANKNGKIIYEDSNAMKVFGAKNNRKLNDIIFFEGIDQDDSYKLEKAIANDDSIEVPIKINDVVKHRERTKITIDSLERPKGYFVIRGY